MKVLLIVTGLPSIEAPARSVFNLVYAEELKKQGHEIIIIYLRSLNPTRKIIKTLKASKIKCFEIRTTMPKIGFLKKPIFFPNLFSLTLNNKNICSELKSIDIIHAIGGGAVEASYIVSRKFNTPMISQFIGSDLNRNFKLHLTQNNFINGVNSSSFLCFNSNALKKTFQSKFSDKKNLKTIYREVKLNEYEYCFNKDGIIQVLFLGGFPNDGNLKGGHTILDSIKLLINKKLTNKVKFIIGGPNSIRHKDMFRETVNKNIKVEFIGSINKSLVKEQMKNAHIVLIPSLSEGVPNVLYEGMASGNMIIGTNVGGIPEILKEGDEGAGKLISPNNPEALAQVIYNEIANINNIEKYAINGRKQVEAIDYSNFVNKYLEVYSKSISLNND